MVQRKQMEAILDGVGFEWRGDAKLHAVLEHLWILCTHSTDSTRILLSGSTGTGKELLAHATHLFRQKSDKKRGQLRKANCAMLSPSMAHMQLFGAKKGAYTGSVADSKGIFQLASGAEDTVFLDEVFRLRSTVWEMLLRVLSEKTFERLGDENVLSFEGNVVSAGSSKGRRKFTEDLSFRLKRTGEVFIPPLEERALEHRVFLIRRGFLHHLKDKKDPTVEAGVMDALLSMKFPGNVRDLYSLIEQLVAYARCEQVDSNSTDVHVRTRHLEKILKQGRWNSVTEEDTNHPSFERSLYTIMQGGCIHAEELLKSHRDQLVHAALDRHNGNKQKVAIALGILPRKLYRILESMGLHTPNRMEDESA